ncbi:MAG TPA: nuclear transport factor 2 family protein [Cellvibrionaceae bacterium]
MQGALAQEKPAEPIAIVNARMDAYNKHDINAFLKLYSNDIQIFTFPNIALGAKGKDHLRGIFEPMFKEGNVGVKIHRQIVQGRYVINDETVSYGGKDQKYVSIYEVQQSLITSVQFVRE